jgi:hypothetical protein
MNVILKKANNKKGDDIMATYIDYIRKRLKGNSDFKDRIIHCDNGHIHIFYIDNLCDSTFISEFIITPLMRSKNITPDENIIEHEILYGTNIGHISKKDDALFHILSGDVVISFDFMDSVIFCEAKGFSKRSISIPITETVIKGPREGFTEVLADNLSMIRRRIKSPYFEVETKTIGRESNTTIAILYMKHSAPDELVHYVQERINNIRLDFLLDTNYLEEQLKCSGTFFDTIGYTEKPDIAASKLFEGKIAILVDGTPFAITAPYFFWENFQMADDYYLNKYFTNSTRILRIIAFLIAVFSPGIYLALNTYHFSLIPIEFVFRLASSRADVPIPTVIEVLVMSFFFQLLREAGIRLPQPIGQAMSIVGALILGQSAVGSGLAAQSTVVIIALSSIASFLAPKLSSVVFTWSILIIFFSSLLGLIGFFMGLYIMVAHIASLNSCGYPYFLPVSTTHKLSYKDTIVRDDLNNISKDILIEDDDE